MITQITTHNAKTYLERNNGDFIKATLEVGKLYNKGILTETEKNDTIEVLSSWMVNGIF